MACKYREGNGNREVYFCQKRWCMLLRPSYGKGFYWIQFKYLKVRVEISISVPNFYLLEFPFLSKAQYEQKAARKRVCVKQKRQRIRQQQSSEHHLILLKQICYFGCLKKKACLLDKPEWFQRNDYNLSYQVSLKRVSIQPMIL